MIFYFSLINRLNLLKSKMCASFWLVILSPMEIFSLKVTFLSYFINLAPQFKDGDALTLILNNWIWVDFSGDLYIIWHFYSYHDRVSNCCLKTTGNICTSNKIVGKSKRFCHIRLFIIIGENNTFKCNINIISLDEL